MPTKRLYSYHRVFGFCLYTFVMLDAGFAHCQTLFHAEGLNHHVITDSDEMPFPNGIRAIRIETNLHIQTISTHNRRRLLDQFYTPSYAQLNSSTIIYPDIAIRASDGSYLV